MTPRRGGHDVGGYLYFMIKVVQQWCYNTERSKTRRPNSSLQQIQKRRTAVKFTSQNSTFPYNNHKTKIIQVQTAFGISLKYGQNTVHRKYNRLLLLKGVGSQQK